MSRQRREPRIRALMPAPGWRSLWAWREEDGWITLYEEVLVGWAALEYTADDGEVSEAVEAIVLADGAQRAVLESQSSPFTNSKLICYLQPGEALATRREYALNEFKRREHMDDLCPG